MSQYKVTKISDEYDRYSIQKERIVNYYGFGWDIVPDLESGVYIQYFETEDYVPRKSMHYGYDAIPIIIGSMVKVTASSYPDIVPRLIESLSESFEYLNSKPKKKGVLQTLNYLIEELRQTTVEVVVDSPSALQDRLNEIQYFIDHIKKMIDHQNEEER